MALRTGFAILAALTLCSEILVAQDDLAFDDTLDVVSYASVHNLSNDAGRALPVNSIVHAVPSIWRLDAPEEPRSLGIPGVDLPESEIVDSNDPYRYLAEVPFSTDDKLVLLIKEP